MANWFLLVLTVHFVQIVTAITEDLHRRVPPTCPVNRTRVVEVEGTTKTILGEVQINEILSNILDVVHDDDLTAAGTLFVDTGGIYLHSTPIPHDSTILSIRAFGYAEDDILERLINPDDGSGSGALLGPLYLFAVVYRPDPSNGVYTLVQEPANLFHELEPGQLPLRAGSILDWAVKQGDLVGIFIPDECKTFAVNETVFESCPSQPNLVTPAGECLSAKYFPNPGTREEDISPTIPMDALQEVQLRLNFEVTLQAKSGAVGTNTVIAVVVILVALILLGVLVFVPLTCWLFCSRKKGKYDVKDMLAAQQDVGMSATERRMDPVEVLSGDEVVRREKIVAAQTYTYIDDYDNVPLSPQEKLNGYTLITEPKEELPITENPGYRKSGIYEYDYMEPYFEPAEVEEDLLTQLSTKLAVKEIPRESMKLCEVLGSGAFGTVYKGVWHHHDADSDEFVDEEVAVKTMEVQDLTDEDRVHFLQEAAMMAQFKHTNVLTVKGVLMDKPMMIVVDLMRGGDMRQYFINTVRPNLKDYEQSTLASQLLSYSRQIIIGMCYLKLKSFIHRDLAARNILMSEDGMVCKIADLGMSRDLQNQNFYVSHGGKVPVKWTAPEAIKYRTYSHASDMWSYGCVLYEIWSLGEKPFQNMTNQEAMRSVNTGYRLPPPPGCPRKLYNIMVKCWNPNPDRRPTVCENIQALQQADFYILKWTANDEKQFPKDVRTLGSPLHLGKGLYSDLQEKYAHTQPSDNDTSEKIDLP